MVHRVSVLSRPAPNTPRTAMMALGLGLALAALPAMRAHAFGAPDSFAELAEQVSPSVVNITTTSMVASPTEGQPMVPPGSPL